jgi:hypothetical protein
MAVKVSDKISSLDVSMTCPNVTATQEIVSCIFTSVRGSDLTATFSYNTTVSYHSILNIPSKTYQKITK